MPNMNTKCKCALAVLIFFSLVIGIIFGVLKVRFSFVAPIEVGDRFSKREFDSSFRLVNRTEHPIKLNSITLSPQAEIELRSLSDLIFDAVASMNNKS